MLVAGIALTALSALIVLLPKSDRPDSGDLSHFYDQLFRVGLAVGIALSIIGLLVET